LDLAQRSLTVASRRHAETIQKRNEGLIGSAELLRETAEQAKAQMQVLAARFQHQVATATLLNVMGKTETDLEVKAHDSQS
jgi:outer membrane protein TolC